MMIYYKDRYKEGPAVRYASPPYKQTTNYYPTMNLNARAQLKQTLKNDGVKAVKQVAKEKYGVSKPAHQGKMVVAQAVVKEALNQVEQDARALIEELDLSLAIKGNLLSVVDRDGEYVAHAFAWGQLILNLKVWQQNQPQKEVTSTPTPTPTPTRASQQPRNLYLLNNWRPAIMAIQLGETGDSGSSSPEKRVTVQLKDGSRKAIGKISLSLNGGFFVSSGLWDQILPATEQMLAYSIGVMLDRNIIQLSDLADIPFNSVWYLGF